MHRLQSASALRSFKLGTFFLLMFVAALLAFAVIGGFAIVTQDEHLMLAFLTTGVAVPVFGLFYMMVGSRARCPLCMNPPLVPRRCQKHRAARPMFGSHRLRIAASIVLHGSFTCPHCGEVTRLVVRDRHRRR